MPDYTIHIHQGSDMTSDIVSLPDVDAARREATGVFADLARDIANKLSQHPDWRIEVMEPAGEIVFKLGLLAEDLPRCEMGSNGREIYHSENGDRWLLCRKGDHNEVDFSRSDANDWMATSGTSRKIRSGSHMSAHCGQAVLPVRHPK
jgi:hypothetical protein